jgi:biopolymer transport protein ExbD
VESVDKLLVELKKKHETVENKENIKIQPDGKLKWEAVIQVVDVCKQAGFKNISFVPPPDFHMSGQ